MKAELAKTQVSNALSEVNTVGMSRISDDVVDKEIQTVYSKMERRRVMKWLEA